MIAAGCARSAPGSAGGHRAAIERSNAALKPRSLSLGFGVPRSGPPTLGPGGSVGPPVVLRPILEHIPTIQARRTQRKVAPIRRRRHEKRISRAGFDRTRRGAHRIARGTEGFPGDSALSDSTSPSEASAQLRVQGNTAYPAMSWCASHPWRHGVVFNSTETVLDQ